MTLLFPDGKLLSPRWRAIVWLNGVMAVAGSLTAAFLPGPSPFIEAIDNPFGVEGLRDVKNLVDGVLEALSYGILVVAGLAALYVRFRRGLGAERQQIKWLAYAGTVLLTGTILLYAGPESLSGSWLRQVGFALQAIGLVGLPVAIGIAIFKYRLFEIDLLLNRTLVYGSLTVTLVALYFGGIMVLQRLFVLLTGQQSTLAVVASTLITYWATYRWVVERTGSWHNAHNKLVWCTERVGRVIDFWVAFSDVVIIVRRLLREGWDRYRWEGRPSRRP
jgi:hypothetical protein